MHADVIAFAPATVANVGIGFDILGHTMEAVGDRVRLRRIAEPLIRIRAVTGIAGALPVEPGSNTAGRALQAMRAALDLDFGFEIEIDKGIPLASGMGGSAASAVAAVVAANALIEEPAPRLKLLKFAMEGELVASGSVHVDNIAPCLFGGLVLTVGIDHPRVKQIPVPASIRCVLVHPHMQLGTREARAVLKSDVTRSDFVWQTANLAGFISGCYSNDLDMIRDSFNDVIIEPQRQRLIPGFRDVQRSAMSEGALGCSISGAGPAIFAWAEIQNAEGVRAVMTAAFSAHGLKSDSWISALDNAGARVVDA
jgi:homoserine kinase